MASQKSILLTPAPYHLLSYGTLLGASLFQSFIGGIIAFRVLPRPSFSVLQQNTFPVYFGIQTLLPAILLLTYPTPTHIAISKTNHEAGMFAVAEDTTALVTLGLNVLAGAINWWFVGPATTKVMRERKVQETRDGKKYYEPGEQSEAMKKLNKRFGALHGASTLVNLAGIISSIVYGVHLSKRL